MDGDGGRGGAPRLQPMVRARVEHLGAAGTAWRDGLPALLDRLAAEWGLTWGRGLPGGSASYVVAAERDGETFVVKVPIPDAAIETRSGEARVLRAAAGRGYALLHAEDPASGAMLLERLGPSLDRRGGGPLDQALALVDTLREAWTVDDPEAPRLDKAGNLVSLIGELLPRLQHERGVELPAGVLRQWHGYAERRSAARSTVAHVLVHGDAHPSNTLRVLAPREGAPAGYALVDPDGFVEDPAYDLGVVLRDFSSHLRGHDAPRVLRGWCDAVGERAEVDPQRVWEWAFLERVSTGLYVIGFGAERVGAPFLETASLLVE